MFVLCLFIPYPHGYKVSRGVPVNFAFEITLSPAIMLALLLVCSFSPRVHSIPRGPHILKKRIRMMCCFCCMGQFMGKNPKTCFRRSAVACKRLRYAPCVTLQTLCVALLFILDLHYAEHALLSHVINCAFDQTNAFNLFVCLMLVYSLSPRVQSIPRGPR